VKLVYDIPVIAKNPKIKVIDYKKADIDFIVEIDNPVYKFSMPGKVQMGPFGINYVQDMNADKRVFTVPVCPTLSSTS